MKHNSLETVYLITSLFVLLAGMTFQSGVTAVGGRPYYLLTYVVAIVLVACVSAFVSVLGLEVWRSVRFARKLKHVKQQATAPASEGTTAWRSQADHPPPPPPPPRPRTRREQSLAADHVQLHGSDGTNTVCESRWVANPMNLKRTRTVATAPPIVSSESDAIASESPTGAAASSAAALAQSENVPNGGGDGGGDGRSTSIHSPVVVLSRQLRATATPSGLGTVVPGREVESTGSPDDSHRLQRVRRLLAPGEQSS